MAALEDLLAHSGWTDTLTESQRRRVRSAIRVRRFQTGECICRRGEPTETWTGVIDGLVRLSIQSRSGKPLSFITGIPAGSWFGEGSLLKREARKYDVVAVRPSVMAFLPAAVFFDLLEESVGLNRFLLDHLNERLGQFISYVECGRLLTPEQRVAHHLASLFNPILYPGTRRELQISQEELGNLIGISRQRVNRALQVLQGLGIVAVRYGVIQVLDLAALGGFARGEGADPG